MADITHEHSHRCAEVACATGRRNRFFKGKRMTYQAFALDQTYQIERRRLLNQSLYGWGVICGLSFEPKRRHITAGVALDRHGRELVLTEETRLELRDCFIESNTEGLRPGRWILRAHYAERWLNEQLLPTDCGCEDREWNEICETVVFSLQRLERDERCPLGEPPCPACHCHHAHDCCPREPAERTHDWRARGCLCQWSAERTPDFEESSLCEWRERKLRFALCDPVTLACLHIVEDDCQCLIIESVEECEPRRLVKRNDALYDLIRGCDLTRIERVSWEHWHRRPAPIPWDDFRKKFHAVHDQPHPHLPDLPPGARPRITDFKVWFTKPVEARTLTNDCFALSALLLDKGTGWERVKRVPILGLATETEEDGAPRRLTHWAAVVVDKRWLADEIRGTWSEFDDGPTTIEIEIRGDFILDCNGQAVSGAAIGFHPVPSGNGSPGGTFISTFRVASKPDHD